MIKVNLGYASTQTVDYGVERAAAVLVPLAAGVRSGERYDGVVAVDSAPGAALRKEECKRYDLHNEADLLARCRILAFHDLDDQVSAKGHDLASLEV
jgi:hypothetical protein